MLIGYWTKSHTLPVVTSFVMNVTSVVPLGPGPTSHTWVSRLSPGYTGAVNLTPKNFRDRGLLLATSLMIPRAAKPKVDRPWRMAPPNPADLPTLGSVETFLTFFQFRGIRSLAERTNMQRIEIARKTVTASPRSVIEWTDI